MTVVSDSHRILNYPIKFRNHTLSRAAVAVAPTVIKNHFFGFPFSRLNHNFNAKFSFISQAELTISAYLRIVKKLF